MAAPAAASATRVSRVCCARSAKAIDSPPPFPQGSPSFLRSFIRSFSRLLYHCGGLQNARAMLHLLRVFAPHLRRVRHSQPLLRETRQILLQKRLHSSFHARLRGTCRPFPPLLFFAAGISASNSSHRFAACLSPPNTPATIGARSCAACTSPSPRSASTAAAT